MRVLITGATGFVGSHAVAACLANGWEVGALVLPAEAPACGERLGESVVVFSGSLEAPPWTDLEAWHADACIHCAWVATPGEYLESPLNLDFLSWSKAFLERLARCGVRRLVGVGSCAESLVAEQGEEAPLYARCKAALRQFLVGGELGNASCAWARLYYPYGVGEHSGRLPSALCRSLLQGRPFSLRSPDVAKDYIHIDDVATALQTLASTSVPGEFDVGSGQATTLGRLARHLAERLGHPELLLLGREPDALGPQLADCRPLASLGWQPRRSLEEGLDELADHWATRIRS